MATFKQAIKWLKEGKKVRRKEWFEFHMVIGDEEEIVWDNKNPVNFYIGDFEAKDWIIYRERDL